MKFFKSMFSIAGLAVALTSIWLALGAIYVYLNWNHVIILDVNELGDALAGYFSPLAFLWLVVATFLQRNTLSIQTQELTLQRNELAETRGVLGAQQRQLAVSADASKKQAKIMERNFNSGEKLNQYRLFSIELYYLALFFKKNQHQLRLRRGQDHFGNSIYCYNFVLASDLNSTSEPEVDSTINYLNDAIQKMLDKLPSKELVNTLEFADYAKCIGVISRKLQYITSIEFQISQLCQTRIDALNLEEMTEKFAHLDQVLRDVVEQSSGSGDTQKPNATQPKN